MKKWIWTAVVLVGAYLGLTQWQQWRAKMDSSKGPERLTSSPVIQTNINFAVNAAGEIGPAEQVSVRPEINGKIDLLTVDVGDRVSKGSILFALDDKELQNERASNKTTVERARLELDQAKRNYERAQELIQAKLISQELYENTKTAYDLAKNSLERAEKEMAILEERLTKTQVRAPFDCTVLTRPVSVGQAVSGSGGFNSGTEVLTIADLNSMVINAHVNQADVPRLRPDQEVEVTVEAVLGLKVTGVVERIAPQATIKNNIKGFAARILLKNVDQRVRPGMTANIKIPVASAENVLAVPLAAVFTERGPDNGPMERYVFVKRGESFERHPVQVGVSDFFYAEIQNGLSPGDVVAMELPKEEKERQGKGMVANARPGDGTPKPSGTSVAGTGAKPSGATAPSSKATSSNTTPAKVSGTAPAAAPAASGSTSAATSTGTGVGTGSGGAARSPGGGR